MAKNVICERIQNHKKLTDTEKERRDQQQWYSPQRISAIRLQAKPSP